MSAYEVHMLGLDEIKPYTNNPRNNEAAVEAVIASIIQFGFRVPILVDKDNVIVAGHTRFAAVNAIIDRDPTYADQLGRIPCFRADDLTEDQVRAFRLVDNKVSELAEWNFDLLAGEVSLLTEAGINLTEFGWSQEEVDCLKAVVSDDCLNPDTWVQQDGDGINGPLTGPRSHGDSSDGSSVRATVGTFGFMVLRADYDKWFDEIMQENDFDFDRATNEVARRLGLSEAKEARANFLRRQAGVDISDLIAPKTETEGEAVVTV